MSAKPGEMHPVDRAFYKLTVAQRDKAWRKEEELEVLLQQALSTIEFLHGCLTDPHVEGYSGGYSYDYPEHTTRFMKELESVLPKREICIHSGHVPDCRGCQQGARGAGEASHEAGQWT